MRHALDVLLAAATLTACTRAASEPPATSRIKVDAAGPPADAQAAGTTPDAGEPPFPARAASGARLKVLYGKAPDGEKYFLWSFYDTMLKIPCAFDLAQDGKRRCLPLPPQVSLPYSTDCTGGQPLFPADDACAAAYARMKIGGRLAIYKVGAALVPPRAVRSYSGPIPVPVDAGVSDAGAGEGVVGGIAGGCGPDAVVAGQKFLPLGDLVPPDAFVETELDGHAIPQPGRRLLLWGRVAADGSKERYGYFDANFNQRCNVEVAADGALRCLPAFWLGYPRGYFEDPDCGAPLSATTATGWPSPLFIVRTDGAGCPVREIVYDAEPRPNLTEVYVRRNGICTAIVPDPTLHFYALKKEHPAADFDQFTETREGTGRLQRRVLRNAGGIVDRLSDPFDRDFGDRCIFAPTSDGMLRCVPPPGGRDDLYADAACGRGAARVARSLCVARPAAHATRMGGPWCAAVAQVLALSASPAATHQRDLDGMCEATAESQYFELGPPLPPTGFVAAQQITE